MIKKLNISNFQSHKDSQLEFAPGVNVIVGASDSGKSAIIRALRWLIWNRPTGDAFISHWADGGFVNIVTDDYKTIQRAKGPKGNLYRINDEEFKAFGNDVPQSIQEILNLDETNLQRQGDSPFLISSTPGEVSGYFNRVAKLDKIDSSLKYITGKAKALTHQIKSDESRLQDLELEAGKFRYLDGAEAQLVLLEGDSALQQQRKTELSALNKLCAEFYVVEASVIAEQQVTSLEDDVEDLLNMHAIRTQVDADRDLLQDALIDLRICETKILTTEEEIQDLPLIDAVLDNQQRRDEILISLDGLQEIMEELRDIDNAEITIGLELRDHEERFHELLPKICPLCGK